ncbi:hypothetical protein SAMN05444972_101105 [Marininema halotolerans]|uniref:Uncharacterized protein n=1 Tax=Marininema halotolerans TaxID=1155944 RepID=A0A1I6NT36_9BACL|nr:hypothetical protein SAMN05444972_101105 [Marininema halotolerans]
MIKKALVTQRDNVTDLERAINNNFRTNQRIRVGTVDGSFTEGRFRYARNSVIAIRKEGRTTDTLISLTLGWCYGPL